MTQVEAIMLKALIYINYLIITLSVYSAVAFKLKKKNLEFWMSLGIAILHLSCAMLLNKW